MNKVILASLTGIALILGLVSSVALGQTPVLTTITLTPATVAIGDTLQLVPTLSDQFGNPITATTTWSSSNTAVGTVNDTGLFTAVALGTTTITASSGSVSGSAVMTVIPANDSLSQIIVAPNSANVLIGGMQQFTAFGITQLGSPIVNLPVSWTSSNTAVGTINSSGLFAGMSAGTTTITAQNGTTTGTAIMTVSSLTPTLSVIAITPSPLALPVGNTQQFSAIGFDQSGNPIANLPIAWSSSNIAVGTISDFGLFTALSVGTTTITAQNGNVTSSLPINVVASTTPVLTTITVSPSSATLTVGNIQQFTAHPRDQFGNPITATTTWSSSNTTVGTINSLGLFTALTTGTSTITAMSGNVSGTAGVTVFTSTSTPTSIAVTPTAASLNVGDTQQFTAKVFDQSGNQINNMAVTWNLSNSAIGTLSDSGLFTATASGSSSITATAGNAVGTATVTVSQQNGGGNGDDDDGCGCNGNNGDDDNDDDDEQEPSMAELLGDRIRADMIREMNNSWDSW